MNFELNLSWGWGVESGERMEWEGEGGRWSEGVEGRWGEVVEEGVRVGEEVERGEWLRVGKLIN